MTTLDFKLRVAAIANGANPDDAENFHLQYRPSRSRAFLTRKSSDRETPSEALAAARQQKTRKGKVAMQTVSNARLAKMIAQTVESLRAQWPQANDWKIVSEDRVEILDAKGSVIALCGWSDDNEETAVLVERSNKGAK